jgi:hypothetical protein
VIATFNKASLLVPQCRANSRHGPTRPKRSACARPQSMRPHAMRTSTAPRARATARARVRRAVTAIVCVHTLCCGGVLCTVARFGHRGVCGGTHPPLPVGTA